MKMAFIGDSLVSCTTNPGQHWYDIASKKMGFDVVTMLPGAN